MTGTTQSARGKAAVVWKTLGGVGPDLLMIHGFGADRLSRLANTPSLMQSSRVAVLDLPGHGAAGSAVGDGGVESLSAVVEAAIDQTGSKRLTLMDHSLGGSIALMLAARRPDLVEALVLIAPAGLGRGVDADFLSAFPRLSTAEDTESLLRRLVVKPSLINRQLVALVQTQLAAEGAREALHRIAAGIGVAGAALRAAAEAVSRYGIPRLTFWGEADGINPADPAALSAFGGSVRLLPEVGHLPHVEAAAAVNREVAAFLATTRAA